MMVTVRHHERRVRCLQVVLPNSVVVTLHSHMHTAFLAKLNKFAKLRKPPSTYIIVIINTLAVLHCYSERLNMYTKPIIVNK